MGSKKTYKDVNHLSKKNMLEKLGDFTANNPRQVMFIGTILSFILVLILASPYIINVSQKSTVEKYLNKTDVRLTEIKTELNNVNNTLNSNKKIYVDYDYYIKEVLRYDKEFDVLKEDYLKLKRDFENNKTKEVLKEFTHYKDKDKKRVLFTDRLEGSYISYDKLQKDVFEVKSLDADLLSKESLFKSFEKRKPEILQSQSDLLKQIKINGKNQRVKEKSERLYSLLALSYDEFSEQNSKINLYSPQRGSLNLTKLKELSFAFEKINNAYFKVNNDIESFSHYWNELHEEYYTKIVKNYYDKKIDYVVEPNPLYKEWTEQESYTDTETKYKTETYIERVYVGSRIVGDSKQDIYENQTKTKEVPYEVPVTKTRSVTKNNGQPRTVSVPYDEYHFYYTREKVSQTDRLTENIEVGKKHAKYDTFCKSWNYNQDEQEGYVVWKQYWNDNEGIQKGKGIYPVLERKK